MTSWAVSPFPWFGGKQRLARRIVGLLPEHLVYVEPFGGACAVLLSKPRARLDVYNDVSEGLVNFFRVLRDQPDELERLLRLTPFSRREFEHCRDTWSAVDDAVELAPGGRDPLDVLIDRERVAAVVGALDSLTDLEREGLRLVVNGEPYGRRVTGSKLLENAVDRARRKLRAA